MYWLNNVFVDYSGTPIDPQPKLPQPNEELTSLEQRNTELESATPSKAEFRANKVSAPTEGK